MFVLHLMFICEVECGSGFWHLLFNSFGEVKHEVILGVAYIEALLRECVEHSRDK